MIQKLVRHGNSLALIIEKPVLDLLGITEETLLEVKVLKSKCLNIRPQSKLDGR
jgi:antitoxin component of MazEF toxin-antitoxin module